MGMNNCADVVEKRRIEYGMTIKALANKSGMSESALYNVLSKRRKMTASELLCLSQVLHLTFDDYRSTQTA